MTFKKITIRMMTVIIFLFSYCSVFAIGFDTEKTYESVFVIETEESIGSGFAIGKNSIITNAHVVGDSETVLVETRSGAFYYGNVVSVDIQKDIAVILVENANFPVLQVARGSDIIIGADVYAIGAPEGLSYTITKGILSSKDRIADDEQIYLQSDVPINPGNSGGPLLNDKGHVIGVNTWKYTNTEGISFSIPISVVTDYLGSYEIKLNRNGNVADYLEASSFDSRNTSAGSSTPGLGSNYLVYIFFAMIALIIILIIVIVRRKLSKPTIQANPGSIKHDYTDGMHNGPYVPKTTFNSAVGNNRLRNKIPIVALTGVLIVAVVLIVITLPDLKNISLFNSEENATSESSSGIDDSESNSPNLPEPDHSPDTLPEDDSNIFISEASDAAKNILIENGISKDGLFGGYKWLLLKKDEGRVLLITTDFVSIRSLSELNSGGRIKWDSAALRQWLNKDFLEEFSNEEIERIVETKVVTPKNELLKAYGGEPVNDKIFLLSIQEAELLFPSDESRRKGMDKSSVRWWLRSSSSDELSESTLQNGWFAYVNSDGEVSSNGRAAFEELGVRPALWVAIEN